MKAFKTSSSPWWTFTPINVISCTLYIPCWCNLHNKTQPVLAELANYTLKKMYIEVDIYHSLEGIKISPIFELSQPSPAQQLK